MNNQSTKPQIDIERAERVSGLGSEPELEFVQEDEKKENVPPARRRAKTKEDKNGVIWEHQGMWIKQALLKEYDRMILAGRMKGLKLFRYRMMNEDMERGLKERKKTDTEKLKEAGQEELGI